MKLNKKEQYAVLICLYLSRAGQARLEDVSVNLGMSLNFLEQIARKLRMSKILRSIRGPGGGYALIGDPTVLQILRSVGTELALSGSDSKALQSSIAAENRSLALFASRLSAGMQKVLSTPVSVVGAGLVKKELDSLDNLSTEAVMS